jgi:hypothetical protein
MILWQFVSDKTPGRCRGLLAFAAALALAGCTSGMGAAVQSVRELLPKGGAVESAKLDPRFEYLRITRGKHVGLLYRGSVESSARGTINVYYGAGEVVRLQDGRIVGALGLTTEWRRVEVEAPSWSAIGGGSGVRIVRTRDVMPGYVSGLREELAVRRIPPVEDSALRGVDPRSLAWFEERAVEAPLTLAAALPPARYAVDLFRGNGTVLYAEQCLAHDLCFTWQRWSAQMQATAAR